MTPERVGSFEDEFKHGRTSLEGKGSTRMGGISPGIPPNYVAEIAGGRFSLKDFTGLHHIIAYVT